MAYGKSGEWLFEGLEKIVLPKTRPLTGRERPFELPVDWARQSAEVKNLPSLTDLRGVDYPEAHSRTTVFLAGFMTKYYRGGPGLFDDYFRLVARTGHLTAPQKIQVEENRDVQRERSMVFYLSFDRARTQVLYYPGKIQFKGGARDSLKEWLPAVPEDIQKGKRTDYALLQDSRGLLSLLNGTFDKIDNFSRWGPKGGIDCGGFGFDFKVMMPPRPEMATFALYEDGRVALGSYRRLPRKSKIREFVQNRFMVLENGKPAKDADPNAFCSFYDNIARSYLFTDKKGRIGYLWTLYTPANVLVPMAVNMGIQNMMLLDIHSPVSCSITDPASPLRYRTFRDYMAHSFDWVPNFFRLSFIKSSLTWVSSALHSRIQTHYPREAFQLGDEDYFAVFLKNAPESLRVRGARKKNPPALPPPRKPLGP